jgi:hypothetical protein
MPHTESISNLGVHMSSRAIIEYQADSGVWLRFADCSSHSSDVKRMLDACLRSQSWIKKARALDADTKQLIDMAIK